MNKIDTTQVTDPTSLQPFTTKSLAFLQGATQEAMAGILRGLCGELNWTQVTVPGGIAVGGVYPSGNDLSEGFIVASETGNIEDAEIFYYDGQAGVLLYPTPVFKLVETADGVADPVEFSDGVSKNVHTVRRLTVANDVPGSGIFDYADLLNLKTYQGGALTYGTGYSTYTTRTVRYRATPMNDLQLSGVAETVWNVANLIIGTLPANWRPTTQKNFICQWYDSTGAGWGTGDITIATNGDIAFGPHTPPTPGNTLLIFLDNINVFLKW